MFNFIVGSIHKTGALGVCMLMLIENLFPLIPSELIMPMAGFEAARGTMNPLIATLAGAAGSILGGAVLYLIGRLIGLDRMKLWAEHGGRWFALSVNDIERGDLWFRRWGAIAVCLGRALPGVRGFICIPAGVACMPFASFLVWSSLGATVWSALLVFAGYSLGNHYAEIRKWLNPASDAFFAFCVIVYAVRVVRYRKQP